MFNRQLSPHEVSIRANQSVRSFKIFGLLNFIVDGIEFFDIMSAHGTLFSALLAILEMKPTSFNFNNKLDLMKKMTYSSVPAGTPHITHGGSPCNASSNLMDTNTFYHI